MINVNGTAVSFVTVDRTQHTFSYRLDNSGSNVISFTTGSVTESLTITVSPVSIDVEAETDSLVLYLNSASRSNSEANPAVWEDEDNNISCSFSNFNWTSDGWIPDDDGVIAMKVAGDARLTIPFRMFASDFRSTGRTIEIDFSSEDVLDYDAVILSCVYGGRGLTITPQNCTLASEQSSISMQYKENEHVRVSFVIEKSSGLRRMYAYVNGIQSGVIQYAANDDFEQTSPVYITPVYGYCKIDDEPYQVKEDEAEIVRRIFGEYEKGMSVTDIAKRLNAEGISSPKGNAWIIGTLTGILKNPVYVGDILTNKTFIENHITHKCKVNRGEVEQYVISDHHEPIVEREQFDGVQTMLKMRADDEYPFQGYLICPCCGRKLKKLIGDPGVRGPVWGCADDVFLVPMKKLEDAVLRAYKELNLDGVTDEATRQVNPVYVGDVEFGKKPSRNVITGELDEIQCHRYVEGHHAGIVDRETWDAVQAKLKGLKRDAEARGHRDQRVFDMLTEGMRNKEIAVRLGIPIWQVNASVRRLKDDGWIEDKKKNGG